MSDHTEHVTVLVSKYVDRLDLSNEPLWVTTERRTFESWLGRRVNAAIGGAYVFLARHQHHAVLINVARIDMEQPKALEIVVAEELIHMRDWANGDRRGHAHHGHDRIASRVAELVGVTLAEVRSALLPTTRRPYRYVYACPGCGLKVPRRKRGRWSCRRCSPRFGSRFELRIVAHLEH